METTPPIRPTPPRAFAHRCRSARTRRGRSCSTRSAVWTPMPVRSSISSGLRTDELHDCGEVIAQDRGLRPQQVALGLFADRREQLRASLIVRSTWVEFASAAAKGRRARRRGRGCPAQGNCRSAPPRAERQGWARAPRHRLRTSRPSGIQCGTQRRRRSRPAGGEPWRQQPCSRNARAPRRSRATCGCGWHRRSASTCPRSRAAR